MKKAYVDTSAYLAVLLGERGCDVLRKAIKGCELYTSALLFVEAQRCVVRLLREKILSVGQSERYLGQIAADVNGFVTRDVTIDIGISRIYPALRTPRSSDLIHLRTALWFMDQIRPKLDFFVTVDESQTKSARELGLTVVGVHA